MPLLMFITGFVMTKVITAGVTWVLSLLNPASAFIKACKAIYEKLTRAALNDLPIIYLYHRRLLIAHTTRLEGYKQMPDGLVRVIGLKLK